MKTSIIHPRSHGRAGENPSQFERIFLPTEKPGEGENAPGIRAARFYPAHISKGERVISIDPWKTRPFTEKVPDTVLGCPLERGKSECVRLIPEPYRVALDDLDRQIEDLSKARRELVEEAYRHGRPLRKADVVTEQKEEAR